MPKNRILIVEDHESFRTGMELLLGRAGYEVQPAATLRQALAMLNGQSAVIIDLALPDGNGAELVDYIHHTAKGTAIAIVTALHSGDQSLLLKATDLVLEKPLTEEKMDALLQWLGRAALND